MLENFLHLGVTLAQSVLLAISSYVMQSKMIPKGLCDEIEQMVKKFIWVMTLESQLWLIRIQSANLERMVGLGWGTWGITTLHSWWRLVITLWQTLMFYGSVFLNQSIMWKMVCWNRFWEGKTHFFGVLLQKVWPLIRENLMWSIRVGKNINCWRDPWIPKIGALENISPLLWT